MLKASDLSDLSGLDRRERVTALRRRLAAMPGGAEVVSAATCVDPVPTRGPSPSGVPVPEGFASLVPGGVLPAGRVLAVDGGVGLRVGLVAAALAAGTTCAVVGYPWIGVAAVLDQAGLGQEVGTTAPLVLVPEAGPDPAAVVAVLLDGVDLVVVDPSVCTVAPARARVVAGRVRTAGSVLVVAPGWPGAEVLLGATRPQCTGLGRGHGRVRSLTSRVGSTGRDGRSRGVEWVVGACPEAGPLGAPVRVGELVRERVV